MGKKDGKRSIHKKGIITAVFAGGFILLTAVICIVLSVSEKSMEIDDDPLIMTVNGYEIYKTDYLGYIFPYINQARQEGKDLEAVSDELKASAEDDIFYTYNMMKWAEEEGITLGDVTEEELSGYKETVKRQYDSEEAYCKALSENGESEETKDKKIRQEVLINKLQEYVYDFDSKYAQSSDEELQQYYKENGFYAAKHILIYYGATEEDDEKKKALIEEIHRKLQAGADFDVLMKEYSEDPNLENSQNGYVGTSGNLFPEFEEAAYGLEPGEYSETITTQAGYHILMGIEPDADQLREQISYYFIFKNTSEKWKELEETQEVVYSEAYKNMKIDKLKNPYT